MNERPGPITAEEARNYPRTAPLTPLPVMVSVDFGSRTFTVIRICEQVNGLLERSGSSTVLPVPGQSNVDERMPLRFLRPAIQALNTIISSEGLLVAPMPTPTDSLDINGFLSLVNQIATTANAVNSALP